MECDSCNSTYAYKEIDGLILCHECFKTAYPEKIERVERETIKREWIQLEKD